MLVVHKIELRPNNKQQNYFLRACGVARFAYNWALAEWKRQYEEGGKPTESSLRRNLNSIKRTEFPWMLDVTKSAPQQAIKNLGNAFTRFFQKTANYPQFKKKGRSCSFRADNGPRKKGLHSVPVDNKRIKLPVIGWVRMCERIRFSGTIQSVTISKRAGKWFASICIDTNHLPHKRKGTGTTGIDLGIKNLATMSDGKTLPGPKSHTALLERLKRLSRSLSRKKKGSANWTKAKAKLAKLHYRIACIRQDATHKATTEIVLSNETIGIEDLNVRGMLSNRFLARSLSDQSFFEFRRQLEYKSMWYGSKVVVADQYFPSTKQCSKCGELNHAINLATRVWTCPECGERHDRDVNAAINLKNLAASSAATACGSEGSDSGTTAKATPCQDEAGRKLDFQSGKNARGPHPLELVGISGQSY